MTEGFIVRSIYFAALCIFVGIFGATGCSGGGGGGQSSPVVTPAPSTPPPSTPPPPAPAAFHCSKDASCPEVLIAGDPHVPSGTASSFHGYGDPSLEYDPDTGVLWMTYTWLDLLVSDPGPPQVIDLGARIHLARSDDGGDSFTFVGAINETLPEEHPGTLEKGWGIHEVSTLVREASDSWQILWLKYFDPNGEPPPPAPPVDRKDFLYQRALAATPESLSANAELWLAGPLTASVWGAPIDLSGIPELANCGVYTEPALFAHSTGTYLATNCLSVDSPGRRTDLEQLVLLKQDSNGYSYVGKIFDQSDALNLGVDTIEQADISIARDGSIILIVTPIVLDADPMHQGCMVFEFADFENAELVRDQNDVAVPRHIITADGNGLGPGLCTYDAHSSTGVLLVITTFTETDIEFSLRATGVHP